MQARPDCDVAVVGAGPGGLSAARELVAAGRTVRVYDKGRGVGGRTCTRIAGQFVFDHGAQYLTVRSEPFAAVVDAMIARGRIARWQPRLVAFDDGQLTVKRESVTRYVGVPGMNALARDMARGLDVRTQTPVSSLSWHRDRWQLEGEDLQATAAGLILALPPRQAAALLPPAHPLADVLAARSMTPCWAVLLGFDQPLATTFDAAFVNTGPLSWVCRNASKPGRAAAEAWVLHASAAWSAKHLEQRPEAVIAPLCEAFAALPGASSAAPILVQAHRWRFAQPPRRNDSAPDIPLTAAQRLACAGDWSAGGRVEGAFLAGRMAARQIDALLAGEPG